MASGTDDRRNPSLAELQQAMVQAMQSTVSLAQDPAAMLADLQKQIAPLLLRGASVGDVVNDATIAALFNSAWATVRDEAAHADRRGGPPAATSLRGRP